MKRTTLLFLITVAALTAALAPSCKKKEEEILPSLSGSIYAIVNPYLRQMPPEHADGAQGLRIMGVTHPEGEAISYYWRISPTMEKNDTLPSGTDLITYDKIPVITEPGTYTFTVGAFAKGYYSKSNTVTFRIVDPAVNTGSLTGRGLFYGLEENDTFYDTRDTRENVYFILKKDGLEWMRNNLAWTGAGVPLYDCEIMSHPAGRFYTWNEAQTACPEGWRLPTDAEWETFGDVAGDLMVNAYFFEEPMWEYWPEVKITNQSFMSVIPSGFCTRGAYNQFTGFFNYAAFWTADSDPDDPAKALYRYINVKNPVVYKGSADKASFGASVRCVR